MSNINTNLKEQPGGWFNISIIPLIELENCPDILTNANSGNVTFAETETDLDILPVGENIKITATPSTTKSGTLHNIKGEVEFVTQSAGLDNYLNNYLTEDVVFIGIQHDGIQKMYGSKIFPLAFSYQFINGTKFEDGARVKITVTGKIPQKPVFIST